ncbi:MAG: exodeoxyribonuclease III [Burkholderiaceae bacterium]|nr:exodeoxyribonuclease III [Burkholderiaceae bacterium]
MLRIVTFNANGIRSAAKKGFWEWFEQQQADILCIQELKAQEADLDEKVLNAQGYHVFMHCAQKRGYSGCALYSKVKPLSVKIGFGNEEFDAEGRYVEAEFDRFVVISVYFPSGSSSEDRQEAKFRFLKAFLPHLKVLQSKGKEILFCGDVNIAHKEIDLKNWKGNLKNSGFLPEERQWMTDLFDHHGWVDVFRRLDSRADQYTWWSQRGQARAKNVGWRIDYQIATPQFAATAVATSIYNGEKFSDHAPLIVDYEW